MENADPEESSATTADERTARRRRLANPALPDDLIVEEILVRLPAKAVLRFRAACHAWRSGSSTPNFLQTYYDRKASLPLVAFSKRAKNHQYDDTLDAFDVLAGAEHRRPVLAFNYYGNDLQDSCEGLLLISYTNGRYNICNPATRQCLRLPGLTGAEFAWLYSSPSADGGVEYHVLFWKGIPAVYFVLTVGSTAQPRLIDLPEGPEDLTKAMAGGIHSFRSPSVLFKAALHWASPRHHRLIVFDTAVELFREMRSPIAALEYARLFEIHGTFGMSLLAGTAVKIWVLQDYETEVWTLRSHIELAMVDRFWPNLDHMVLSNNGELLISCGAASAILVQYDVEGNLIKEFSYDSWKPRITGFRFKENIVRHSFFQRPGKGRMAKPPFFKGL
uniref:Uncharacterized protein n=1 Tax=Avena sativa TaxID=4498 RepID=A0ACD5TMB4_AVESA